MAKSTSGGIKPLNAPRVVNVRTDPVGNPISIQVPPAIDSPRARRTANRQRSAANHRSDQVRIVEELEGNDPHPSPLPTRERGHASPSLQGRELEGGSKRVAPTTNKPKRKLITDGKWMQVTEIENLWKVNDEWWRGPDEEIARLYYVLRLDSGQQLTVYLDLVTNNWYRQAG